jgi:hypothetical protein
MCQLLLQLWQLLLLLEAVLLLRGEAAPHL